MNALTSSRFALGAALLTTALAPLASAQLVNPGFETGAFTSWNVSAGARATVVTTATDYPVDPFTLDLDLTQPYTVAPFAGTYFARLEAGTTSLAATETFLGLSAGALSTPLNNPFGLSDASAIAQSVFLSAGTTIRFNWNFFAVDVEGIGNDYAFFSATGPGSTLSILSTVDTIGSGNGTGWQQLSFTASASGTYRLGFGVANYGDNTIGSTLYLDAAVVPAASAVPEPSTYGLLGAFACFAFVVCKRRRR